MSDRITERDCPYCTWSGPSNKYGLHLSRCPNIDHSTGDIEKPARVVADGGRRVEPGACVVDREEDGDYPSHAVVLDVMAASADDYQITALEGRTVAEENPEYPADADVVLVAFAKDLDELLPGWEDYSAAQLRKHAAQTDLQVYAYPAPRLKRLETGSPAADPGGDAHV